LISFIKKNIPYLVGAMILAFGFLFYFGIENHASKLDCKRSPNTITVSKFGDVLLLGNSLLHDYEWSLNGYRTINCSRQGLTIEKFLSLEIEDTNFDPAFVVIAFGTVEAIRQKTDVNYDQQSFLQNLKELSDYVNSYWPDTKIIITAVPPINNQIYNADYIAPALVDKINTAISTAFKFSAKAEIDLRNILDTDEHGLTDRMTYDGVHLRELAYKRWNFELENLMRVHQ